MGAIGKDRDFIRGKDCCIFGISEKKSANLIETLADTGPRRLLSRSPAQRIKSVQIDLIVELDDMQLVRMLLEFSKQAQVHDGKHEQEKLQGIIVYPKLKLRLTPREGVAIE